MSRRVVRVSECCGREVLERETADEWARAELEHHGQPPAAVVDLARTMRDQYRRAKSSA